MERSTYLWNSPRDEDDRRNLAVRLDDAGCEVVWVKAGGDLGYAWIPGEVNRIPWRPAAQWDDEHLKVYNEQGLQVFPWFYVHPVPAQAEHDAIIRALRHRMSNVLALNPETEWRVASDQNSFRSLNQANGEAREWVEALRRRLAHEFPGQNFTIGYSGVPSWHDFPYEGFDTACDFSHPQHYWFDHDMARSENQVEAHLRRVGKAKPCIPILTASREHDDAGVVELGRIALDRYPDLQGFSSWEAGNGAFQLEAMRAAWGLLPYPEPEPEILVRPHAFSPFIRMWDTLFEGE